MVDVYCNICKSTEFLPFKTRGNTRCAKCGSIDRTRVQLLYLDKFANLRPGMRILHIAPEGPLFRYIAGVVGATYDPRDIDVERYARLKHDGVQVRKLDLCSSDLEKLPSDHYDLVLHNHVLEHLPCNMTAVLYHLHRSLKANGLHMFSLPLQSGRWDETFQELDKEASVARFGQWNHVRRVAVADLPNTLGQVFDIEDQTKVTLADVFGEETLHRHNIPEARWRKLTGANVFVCRKNDIKLQ